MTHANAADADRQDDYQLAPPLSDADRQRLRESIAEHGVLVPVTIDQNGTLLDGHHRSALARELGVELPEPSVVHCSSEEARLSVAATLNADRRQMTDGQRTILGRKLEERFRELARERQRQAGEQHGRGIDSSGTTVQELSDTQANAAARDQVAEAVGLGSGRTYERNAKALEEIEESAPDLYEQIESGEADMREARKEYRLRKKAERTQQIAETPPEDLDGAYEVIYLDPPWRYEHAEPTRKVENHYPTMSLDELKALEVPAADDSVMLMWATSPMLAQAMSLLDAWGFDYRTSMVWVKDKIGMGYYARQRHELLLIARRGNAPVPEPSARPDSVIEAPREQHSAKPEKVYDLIDAMWPHASKVELFARNQRPGWASWGNQAGDAA